jgi:NDP-mannose synthase
MSRVQAVILAGGKGSRLRPYTKVLPKPLVPVDDVPIAEIIIRQLKFHGLKNIVISTGHLAELIEAYFGDGRRWGVHIQYVCEAKPLGTAGALKRVKQLADNFLVINGDTLTNVNFKKLLALHSLKKAAATIVVKERVVKTDFGVIEYDKKNMFVDYIEKPEHRSFVSTGINVLNKECQRFIRRGESIGMPELMLRIKAAHKPVYCHRIKDLWLDLGRPDDLEKAHGVFRRNKKKFLLMSR